MGFEVGTSSESYRLCPAPELEKNHTFYRLRNEYQPGSESKKSILENAVEVAHRLGISNPKVAVLSAIETVNPAMQSSVDAALLAVMNKRGR